MIVRDPEKRATLAEVMSDVWYRQCPEEEDNEEEEEGEIDLLKLISKADHEAIVHQMIDGNIAQQDAILSALHEDQYNHITATYHLLAEKVLYAEREETRKQKRRCLQPASEPFTEQISVFIPSASK